MAEQLVDDYGICCHTLLLRSNVNTCWEKEQLTQKYNSSTTWISTAVQYE